MSNLLASGVDRTVRPAYIHVDEYIPLSFRSYENLLGGIRDIRLGNRASSFLELTLGLDSLTLRGFTLLCFETVHEPVFLGAVVEITGLPILNVDAGEFNGQLATQWLDLPISFSVAVGTDFIEIDFGLLRLADQAITCGSVSFFMSSNSLVGIRAQNLSKAELGTIRRMAAEAHPRRVS